jgi:hypothetical protein
VSSKQGLVRASRCTFVGTLLSIILRTSTEPPGDCHYSIVLHEARARFAPCLLVRLRCGGRRFRWPHCLWRATCSCCGRKLASSFHHRGLFLRMTASPFGNSNYDLGRSYASLRSHRDSFPARSTGNDRVPHGGRAEDCFSSGQSRY